MISAVLRYSLGCESAIHYALAISSLSLAARRSEYIKLCIAVDIGCIKVTDKVTRQLWNHGSQTLLG